MALDIVKALVNVGANPLQRIHKNGITLLHELAERINQSESIYDEALSILDFGRYQRLPNCDGVKKVYKWLMTSKGFSNIEQVPYQEPVKPKKI